MYYFYLPRTQTSHWELPLPSRQQLNWSWTNPPGTGDTWVKYSLLLWISISLLPPLPMRRDDLAQLWSSISVRLAIRTKKLEEERDSPPNPAPQGADKPEGASAIYHLILKTSQHRRRKELRHVWERMIPAISCESLDVAMPEAKIFPQPFSFLWPNFYITPGNFQVTNTQLKRILTNTVDNDESRLITLFYLHLSIYCL